VNDTIEDDVRAAFARVTGPVVPRPDPLGRLLARHRRRGWRRGLTAAAAAVVLAAGGGTLAAAPVGTPIGPSPGPDSSETDGSDNKPYWPKARMDNWTRRLIEGPTRGNLADDKAYVSALTTAFRTARNPMADRTLDRVKVLVVTDIAGIRIAVTAFYNDKFGSFSVSQAEAGATPEELADSKLGGMAAGLRPFFVATSGVSRGPELREHEAAFALAPAGCTLDSSDAVSIGADGTAHRTWVPRGDHMIEAGELFDLWWRVTCDGQVRFEGPTTFPGPVPDGHAGTEPAAERGSAHPKVIGAAVDGWRAATRHLGGTAPRVLWAGPTGEGRTTVVVAGPGRDGRQLVTALTDPPTDFVGPGLDNDVRTVWPTPAVYYPGHLPYVGEPGPESGSTRVIPMMFGTATAASTDLVIVRLSGQDSPPALGDRLLVVAPQSATRLQTGAESVTLTDGVGIFPAPAPLAGHTVTALDAQGNVVATARYGEPDGNGQFFGERVLEDWAQ
jgi:hypothetical protein